MNRKTIMPPDLINIHAFCERSHANGPGARAVIWVQGCPHRCINCFNPDSLTIEEREMIPTTDLEFRILTINDIDGVTFSGGEPFLQARPLAYLAHSLKKQDLSIVCYTGYTLEKLRSADRTDWNVLLQEIDLLIDGEYIESAKSTDPFIGSSNQRSHFLSDRFSPEDVRNEAQTTEISIDLAGSVLTTGFPHVATVSETMTEIAKILDDTDTHLIGGNICLT